MLTMVAQRAKNSATVMVVAALLILLAQTC